MHLALIIIMYRFFIVCKLAVSLHFFRMKDWLWVASYLMRVCVRMSVRVYGMESSDVHDTLLCSLFVCVMWLCLGGHGTSFPYVSVLYTTHAYGAVNTKGETSMRTRMSTSHINEHNNEHITHYQKHQTTQHRKKTADYTTKRTWHFPHMAASHTTMAIKPQERQENTQQDFLHTQEAENRR